MIKDVELIDGEILVSFDVSSLFPSVPIPQTNLRKLLSNNNLSNTETKQYARIQALVMVEIR